MTLRQKWRRISRQRPLRRQQVQRLKVHPRRQLRPHAHQPLMRPGAAQKIALHLGRRQGAQIFLAVNARLRFSSTCVSMSLAQTWQLPARWPNASLSVMAIEYGSSPVEAAVLQTL